MYFPPFFITFQSFFPQMLFGHIFLLQTFNTGDHLQKSYIPIIPWNYQDVVCGSLNKTRRNNRLNFWSWSRFSLLFNSIFNLYCNINTYSYLPKVKIRILVAIFKLFLSFEKIIFPPTCWFPSVPWSIVSIWRSLRLLPVCSVDFSVTRAKYQ